MHRRTVFTTLIAVLSFMIGTSVAVGQAQPPGPVVRHLFRTAGLPQPARFNIVQNILNFDPGAATPFHRHPGQVIVTVLEGENTFSVNDVEKIYKAGELSRPEPQDTTPLPRPFVSYQFKTDLQPMAEAFDVVQQVLDFAPGAATPVHTHPGILVVTVLAGELTFKLNGADTVYKEGESFVEVPGQVVQARNTSTAQTSVMVSYVIPKDAPLSTVQHADPAPAALPTTGGAADGTLPIWLIGLAAAGLIAGGWMVRRRRNRA